MTKPDRSKPDHAMRRVLIDIEKAQQALNHKRATLAILPLEIDALQEKIKTLKQVKTYLEGL